MTNFTTSRQNITISPFYHSAVNAVTKPNKFTLTSHYFIDRWMPLLGGNGTLIVLALRRDGFLNRKTGERRDEIVIARSALAQAAGMSEDTLTRELGINKKAGKPQNAWLHLFVQKRTRFKRDRRGRVEQEENAYWVAMDDPVHPDDWHLVEAAVRENEERQEKRPAPETQIASSAPQTAVRTPQTASPGTQTAAPLKTLDSSLPKNTSSTAALPGGSLSLLGRNIGEKPAVKRGEKTAEAQAVIKRGVALGRAALAEAARKQDPAP